ncbi:MAG TPA: DUF4157 domain-containing protein [Gemmatimonadales bacterium]|nr:DUF4157 domain-containing protein [Gemmatimonadales bacterium]
MAGERWAVGGERVLCAAERRALGLLCAALDLSRVRVHRGRGGRMARAARSVVLTVGCGRAVTLGNHVFLPDPVAQSIPVLAHELTHCAQYQAWGFLRYYTRGLAERVRELRHRLGLGHSPYAWEPGLPFSEYGMEQQGQIVEDCFRGCPHAASISPYQPGA